MSWVSIEMEVNGRKFKEEGDPALVYPKFRAFLDGEIAAQIEPTKALFRGFLDAQISTRRRRLKAKSQRPKAAS